MSDIGADDITPAFAGKDSELLVKWQLDARDIVHDIALQLGWTVKFVEDDDGNIINIEYASTTKKPMVNEKCMRTIVQIIASNVNKNTFLADLKNDEVRDIAFRIVSSLLEDFIIHFDEYGIESMAKMQDILYIVENVCEIALTRGREGKTLDHLSTVQRLIEKVSEITSEKGGRRFGFL